MDGSRNYLIGTNVFYVFCLVIFLITAAVSAYILLVALREGIEDQAWISAACCAVAALLAALFWWLL